LHFASRQTSPETQLRWADPSSLKWSICLDTRLRNPIPDAPHRHLPWGMYTESKGLRSVKQAVSEIGTDRHYRTVQKQLECDGGCTCVCTPLIRHFERPHS
jgi:hypothetical protein